LYKVQWQAWLRHTRYEPPSLQELLVDEKRKAIVQDRARVLDEQWEQVGALYFATSHHVINHE
jgi:NADH dehydrogenase [ubiquinone] 1 alpha subcomplex assembly factor 2